MIHGIPRSYSYIVTVVILVYSLLISCTSGRYHSANSYKFLLSRLSFILWSCPIPHSLTIHGFPTSKAYGDKCMKTGPLKLKFKSFEEALEIYYDMPILVSFTSSLCGPCKVMKKELEQVRQTLQEDVIIFHIDTDRFPTLGSRYNVKGEQSSYPTYSLL